MAANARAIFTNSEGTAGTTCPDPDRFRPGDFNNYCDTHHFWSPHPGGAYFVFGDGAVRFVQYTVATSVLPALATRAGGEAIDPSFGF